MVNDNGVQAYCWYQLADFFRAMQLPRDLMSKDRPKLLPSLNTMRLDLVNFCDHLPLGISSFAAVIRWHLGRILDEMVVTGLPDEAASADEIMVLRNLLKDEGLMSSACPAFVSVKDGVKSLPLYGYDNQIISLKKPTGKKVSKKRSPIPDHPEGGQPPKSIYPAGHTVWKWTKDHEDLPKQWIEFDKHSGRPMSEIEDEEEDDDGYDLAALLGLPFMPLFVPPPPPNAFATPDDGDGDSDSMPELVDPEA